MKKTATEKALEVKQKQERNENMDTALELVKSRRDEEPPVVVVPPVVVTVPTETKEKPHKNDDNFFTGFFSGIACSALVAVMIWAINMMVVVVR